MNKQNDTAFDFRDASAAAFPDDGQTGDTQAIRSERAVEYRQGFNAGRKSAFGTVRNLITPQISEPGNQTDEPVLADHITALLLELENLQIWEDTDTRLAKSFCAYRLRGILGLGQKEETTNQAHWHLEKQRTLFEGFVRSDAYQAAMSQGVPVAPPQKLG